MEWLRQLRDGLGREVPLIRQTESAECGLACLAMVAGHHGHLTDLSVLRREHYLSPRGATLATLIRIATDLGLAARPLRLELVELQDLRLPAVLHWNLDHFVVLTAVGRRTLTLHDPARGRREVGYAEADAAFTGVALELTPTARFERRDERETLSVTRLWTTVQGLRPILVQLLALSLVLQVFALGSPWLMQLVIDQVLVTRDRSLLEVLGFSFGLLMLVQTGLGAVRSWFVTWASSHLGMQLVSGLFSHLMHLPLGWFQSRHVGDVASRFGSLEAIQRTLTTSFVEAIIDGVMVLGTLCLMFVYAPSLTWVVLGATLLYTAFRFATYPTLRAASEEQITLNARRQTHFLESVRGMQTLRVFGREPERVAQYQNAIVDTTNNAIHIARLGILFSVVNALLFGIENIAVVWLGALMVFDGQFTVGMLMAFMSYKGNFTGRISALIGKVLEYRMLSMHAERVADIALSEPISQTMQNLQGGPDRGRIQVEGISHRYSPHDPWVLRDVSLDVAPGGSLLITGPSGCGKSTLLRILLGLQTAESGRIRISGVEVSGTQGSLRHLGVAAVLQDDRLLSGTIEENITLNDPRPDREHLNRVIERACLTEDIARMPLGLFTRVGDMGTSLSGGQVQRIQLARALYSRPCILILDEATAHLDPTRARQVDANLAALGITRIIVSHRPDQTVERVLYLGPARRKEPAQGNPDSTKEIKECGNPAADDAPLYAG